MRGSLDVFPLLQMIQLQKRRQVLGAFAVLLSYQSAVVVMSSIVDGAEAGYTDHSEDATARENVVAGFVVEAAEVGRLEGSSPRLHYHPGSLLFHCLLSVDEGLTWSDTDTE